MGNIFAPVCHVHYRKKILIPIRCESCPKFCFPKLEYRCLLCDFISLGHHEHLIK